MSERLRVGIGFDAHAFADGRRLVLAGVEIPSARGLAGHSDADLISHAVTDALLGAAGGARTDKVLAVSASAGSPAARNATAGATTGSASRSIGASASAQSTPASR